MINKVVIVESPFAGDMEGNRLYAIAACADCFRRGETPFASHLLYPQILNELKKEEREQGITAGYAFWPVARRIVFYTDKGWSEGMKRARIRAENLGYAFEERSLQEVPDIVA
jgi:hypothetical protein